MKGVVLITGVMAAGKSTVAQALAERLPRAAHVRGDVFRRMIVSGREEYEPGADDEGLAHLRLRYRLSAATADASAREGFTAVVHVVVLAPRPEVVAAREAGRPKTGYGAWTVADLDGSLRTETPRIGLWLDTSELTVTETVDAILAGRERARIG